MHIFFHQYMDKIILILMNIFVDKQVPTHHNNNFEGFLFVHNDIHEDNMGVTFFLAGNLN